MFNAPFTTEKKKDVIHIFQQAESKLRLISTTAFGLGIDVPDIRIISTGDAPTTGGEYVQESGRCGRNGENSETVLYHPKGIRSSQEIKAYVNNQDFCRRRILFKDFYIFRKCCKS